jgi:DNA polymerase I
MNLAEKYGKKKVFLSMDHSQLEIRVLGQMSGDKLLIELLQSGEDIHSAVGHELTGIPIAKIANDRETRTAIKGIHFGIIYGLQPSSLYYTLKIQAEEHGESFTMSEAQVTQLYNRYFHKFRTVKRFMDSQIDFADEHGYVRTLFGFEREISQAGQEGRTTFWKNQAINSPIQGTAHQLIMMSFAILELKKKTYNLLQDMTMEIHDSLVTFTRLEDLPETYKQGKALLEKDVLEYVKKGWPELEWRVPLKADAKAGFRMGVLVEKYKGEPPEEFVEKWCEKNLEFEKKLAKEIAGEQNAKKIAGR